MAIAISNFVPGWKHDPVRIGEVFADRLARGDHVYASTFAAAHPKLALAGTWQRLKALGVNGVFLRDREKTVCQGHYRRPYLQRRGTCVSRGTARGVQTSLDVAIADRFAMLQPVTVSFAPIYSLARHEIGKDRCGGGDGAILADAMQAVHDYGVANTTLFGSMTEDQIEQMACQYAAPDVGTPESWIKACKGHACVTFCTESLALLFDCIAAGFAVPYAMNYVTGEPNRNGISDLGDFGPHCRCFTSVFVDQNGEDQLGSSESWGRYPAGSPQDQDQTMPVDQIPCVTLKYAGGQRQLPPGDVGVNAKRFWSQIDGNGEAWAVAPPQFAASNVSDAKVQGS